MDKSLFRIKNYRHAYILVFEYIETFYNTTRIHSHCNYMSPNEFEKAYENAKELITSTAS
ncbi:IS3 family transposase [Clostridium kluyveri]|uniref:IS3 family transposase n=1 Tax=Clostridium kluyveri TaxID=1534 RepID=UPI001FA87C73|nr:IS3 family transposase [Clostridium kluyveri]UZQ51468.1 IS3 family transposase [Clostridium kluyveri]